MEDHGKGLLGTARPEPGHWNGRRCANAPSCLGGTIELLRQRVETRGPVDRTTREGRGPWRIRSRCCWWTITPCAAGLPADVGGRARHRRRGRSKRRRRSGASRAGAAAASHRDGLRVARFQWHRGDAPHPRKNPETTILMLSMHSEDTLVRQALEAGARGYILKNAMDLDLVSAVKRVAAGKMVFDPQLASTRSAEGRTRRRPDGARTGDSAADRQPENRTRKSQMSSI